MLKSMTGYGKSNGSNEERKINIEVRSLNSKGLDLFLKLPSIYKSKELELRQLIAKRIVRGKVEVIIASEHIQEHGGLLLNQSLAKSYYSQFKKLADDVGASTDSLLNSVIKLPDVLSQADYVLSEKEYELLQKLIHDAIDELELFRDQEGNIIKNEFSQCISSIEHSLEQIKELESARIQAIRDRITNSLEESKTKIDESRFEQELIYYLEKLDISEEKSRLQNHLNYFRETMELVPHSGKKLGFISQEIGREINTLGSKANNFEIQRLVVGMKDQLEQIKEQVLNTL
jgi:uncharacterized protein (TIGR00255 family)